MAVAMMEEKEEENPVLHDFLGPTPVAGGGGGGASSSGAGGPVSGGSELGSEIQMEKNFEGMHSHRFDTDGRLSGRKRSNSDSSFMDLTREHMLNMASSSFEKSRHVNVFEKETLIARQRRPHVDEIPHSIQPLRMTSSSSHVLQPFINSRMDSISSKWDRPLPPMNPVHMPHHPSRFSQLSPYGDKSSSYAYRDSCMGATLVTPAADEGSRTGIKGSRILDIVNPSTENADRNSTGALCNSNRARSTLQGTEMDFSNAPSRNNLTTATRQMTIFYAGQAHVFDDVHPNKADIIMALAGSNGGSWSTTFSPKPTSLSPLSEAKVLASQNDMGRNKLFSQNTHTKLSIPGNSSHDHVPRVSVGDSPKQTYEDQTSRPVEDNRHVA